MHKKYSNNKNKNNTNDCKRTNGKKKRPDKQNIMVAKHFLENTPCAIAKYKQANQTCAYHELFELQIYIYIYIYIYTQFKT